ncbi:hypothetical protein [Bacillus sp. CH_442]|uniref:hypothetical protein n=1 Tax=Bacillus sp. CH_442 TaxID=2978217 RepID=UPI0030F70680
MWSSEEILKMSQDFMSHLFLFEGDNNEKIHTSFVCGSIFEGFGNKLSDVDIFILCEDIPKEEDIRFTKNEYDLKYYGDFGDKVVLNIIINGLSYDIEFWKTDRMLEIANSLSSEKFNIQNPPKLTKEEYDLFHKSKYAKPIFNESNFTNFQKKISYNNLGKLLADYSTNTYSGSMKDVQGAYASEDYVSSYFMARILLETTLPGYLAIKGETSAKEKWLYKKLLRYAKNYNDQEMVAQFHSFYKVDLDNEENIKTKIKEIMGFCQNLNEEIQEIYGGSY